METMQSSTRMKCIIFCGDDRTQVWMPSSKQLNSSSFKPELLELENFILPYVIQRVTENLEKDPKEGILIMFTYFHDLADRDRDNSVPNNEGFLRAVLDPDLSLLAQQTVQANKEWTQLMPNLRIVWTLPVRINFLEFNGLLASNYEQQPLSEREIRTSLESTQLFDKHVNELKALLIKDHLNFIDLRNLTGITKAHLTGIYVDRSMIDCVFSNEAVYPFLRINILNHLIHKDYFTEAAACSNINSDLETVAMDSAKDQSVDTHILHNGEAVQNINGTGPSVRVQLQNRPQIVQKSAAASSISSNDNSAIPLKNKPQTLQKVAPPSTTSSKDNSVIPLQNRPQPLKSAPPSSTSSKDNSFIALKNRPQPLQKSAATAASSTHKRDYYGQAKTAPDATADLSSTDDAVLIVGDVRAARWSTPPKGRTVTATVRWKANTTLEEAITAAWQCLTDQTQFLVLFAFHNDLVFEKTKYAFVRPAFVIKQIVQVVQEATKKWKTRFPNLNVIWTLPYLVDFQAYNHMKSSTCGELITDIEKKILKSSGKYSKEYALRLGELKKCLQESEERPFLFDIESTGDLKLVDGFYLSDITMDATWMHLETVIKNIKDGRSLPNTSDEMDFGNLDEEGRKRPCPGDGWSVVHVKKPRTDNNASPVTIQGTNLTKCLQEIQAAHEIAISRIEIYLNTPTLHPAYGREQTRFVFMLRTLADQGVKVESLDNHKLWYDHWNESLNGLTLSDFILERQTILKKHNIINLQQLEAACHRDDIKYHRKIIEMTILSENSKAESVLRARAAGQAVAAAPPPPRLQPPAALRPSPGLDRRGGENRNKTEDRRRRPGDDYSSPAAMPPSRPNLPTAPPASESSATKCTEEICDAHQRATHMMEIYFTNAALHPSYEREHSRFSSIRLRKLFAQGIDVASRDLQEDWNIHWKQRLNVLTLQQFIKERQTILTKHNFEKIESLEVACNGKNVKYSRDLIEMTKIVSEISESEKAEVKARKSQTNTSYAALRNDAVTSVPATSSIVRQCLKEESSETDQSRTNTVKDEVAKNNDEGESSKTIDEGKISEKTDERKISTRVDKGEISKKTDNSEINMEVDKCEISKKTDDCEISTNIAGEISTKTGEDEISSKVDRDEISAEVDETEISSKVDDEISKVDEDEMSSKVNDEISKFDEDEISSKVDEDEISKVDDEISSKVDEDEISKVEEEMKSPQKLKMKSRKLKTNTRKLRTRKSPRK